MGTLGTALAGLEHDPQRLRQQAEEILSRSPYTDNNDNVVTRALRWVGDQIASVFGDGLNAVFSVPFVPYLIAGVALVLLLLVVWRMTRGMSFDRSVPAVPQEAMTRSAQQWLADADAHLAAGRRREALRCRYAALVVALVQAGVVDDVPGRTVRELASAVQVSAERFAPATHAASTSFERVFYGRVDVSDQDLEVVAAAAHALLAEPAATVRAIGERA